MTNAGLQRWVFASLASYMKSVAATLSLPSLVLGFEEPNATYKTATDRVEIRITGLSSREPTNEYLMLTADLTVVLHSMLGDTKNRYTSMEYQGAFAEAMDKDIAVYRYGNQTGDDESFVCCMVPMTGKNEGVRFLTLSDLPTVRAVQSVCAVRYRAEIPGE